MSAAERSLLKETEQARGLLRAQALEACLAHGQRVVVDCAFGDCMSEYESNSLIRQIAFTWGAIKKMEAPFALTVTVTATVTVTLTLCRAPSRRAPWASR